MQLNLTVSNLSDASLISEAVLPMTDNHRVFCFHGDLGAGKTTYIKQICKDLGVEDGTSSPSFSIVNEYETNTGEVVYHFDFYRLKSPSESLDIGWEDYLLSENLVLVEWPEMAEQHIPEDAVHIHISQNEDHSRDLTIKFSS